MGNTDIAAVPTASGAERRRHSPGTGRGEGSSFLTLREAECIHIRSVLEACDGNIARTAKALGLHRRSLQRKLSRIAALSGHSATA